MRTASWILGLATVGLVILWTLPESTPIATPPALDYDTEEIGDPPGEPTKTDVDAEAPSREPVRGIEEEPARAGATSSAQTHLTLEGALESTFRGLSWGKGRFANSITPYKDVASVLDDPKLNHEGKELTPAQFEALRSMVDDWHGRLADASDKSWELRRDAMVRASRRGQYAIAESTSDGEAPNRFLPSEARKRMQAAKAAALDLYNMTKTRLGVSHSEWRHSLVSTSEPDGHPKQVLVYFLTRDEPQFVAAEEAFQQAKKARKEAMRAFFERLP